MLRKFTEKKTPIDAKLKQRQKKYQRGKKKIFFNTPLFTKLLHGNSVSILNQESTGASKLHLLKNKNNFGLTSQEKKNFHLTRQRTRF